MEKRYIACGVLGVIAAGAWGCSGPSVPSSTGSSSSTYVGSVAGTDAVVALVSNGASASFYSCGGPTSFATLSRWFSGTVVDDVLRGSSTDGATLDGQLTAAGALGTITLADGTQLSWTARAAVSGTDEGLYSTVDDGCRTGVIVTQPSASLAPSVQGTWCSLSKTFIQVTPILPIVLAQDSFEVTVEGRALYVSPMFPQGP